ncbi:acetyl-/propionyl-CoA carboxylase subunit alpha [Barrientosiimonas endolithica]|uniref:biotin carboxylase n=1 Tax=Barrientosiimonas endolithica TaxID=1535208 RepID=A0ABM8HDA3_9MICO|nr:acetyl-/propionyl-CoA carboxylase subunit alpha [Barrientosiimonas endolithica]
MAPVRKVLIANRGEIAVRIARACKDAGIGSVAVYAEPDRDALHVRVADEAYALGGSTPADSYLVQDKLIEVAQQAGADAVHPGYGFLAENAEFAQKVIDAGLTWIGPGPEAIDALGDKVKARHIALAADAPLVPGTKDPVSGPDEVVAFAQEHGLPVAIKAAYGGGGRGLKVARTIEEIPDLYDSAVREAVTAFGRGECFVELFLDKPRHVETQCLADSQGDVVVVSTRDCSLQRRNQKLVEEAPAPFLTDEQHAELVRASKAILQAAGYVGAGTCEFLVGQDGHISFLEVNTRLQVEHPVSEEVTGIDLVREQLRIAAGEPIGYSDPEPAGHSIEFRINGEDAGRGFLPAPGTVTRMQVPSGPGVRWDAGIVEGDTVAGAFDSMIAKLIVTGANRQQALARSRRALDELEIEGMPTVVPFHRAVVSDPAFAPEAADEPFTVHTRWIETEFDNQVEPYAGPVGEASGEQAARQAYVIEVDGRRMSLTLPADLQLGGGGGAGAPARKPAPKRSRAGGAAPPRRATRSPRPCRAPS